MTYYERSAWTDIQRPVHRLVPLTSSEVAGVALHYTGSTEPLGQTASLALSIRRIEDERAFHTAPPPRGRGWSDIAYCLPTSVEALTTRGWRRPEQLTEDDLLYTLNRDTGMGEWQHPSAINVFSGPRRMLQGYHGLLFTPQHRWPVRRTSSERYVLVESTGLTRHHQVPVAARHAHQPADPKYTDDFVTLVAWFWTVGRVARSRSGHVDTVAIHRSHSAHPDQVDQLRAVLTRLYGPGSPRLRLQGDGPDRCPRGHLRTPDVPPRWSARRSGPVTTILLNAAIGQQLLAVTTTPDTVVTTEFLSALTPAQLDLFIDVSLDADGGRRRPGADSPDARVTSGDELRPTAEERAESFALACVLAGRSVSFGITRTAQGRSRYRVSLLHRRTILPAPDGMTEVVWQGEVWCPTTANRTWLARHDGMVFFSGNSVAMDVEGRVFDARGIAYRSAANGNVTVNRRYGAVTWLIGVGDKPTPALVDAFREWRQTHWLTRYPHATAVVGHRDLHATECPGGPAYALVRSGALTTGVDVPLTETEIDVIATRTRDKLLAVTYGNQPDGRPFTLAMLLGEVRVNAIKAATGVDVAALATAIVAQLPPGQADPRAIATAVADELSLRLKS